MVMVGVKYERNTTIFVSVLCVSVCVSVCQCMSVCVSVCQCMSVCVSVCQWVGGSFVSGLSL